MTTVGFKVSIFFIFGGATLQIVTPRRSRLGLFDYKFLVVLLRAVGVTLLKSATENEEIYMGSQGVSLLLIRSFWNGLF